MLRREASERDWLAWVIDTCLARLDQLDAAGEDLEDDEREDDREEVYACA